MALSGAGVMRAALRIPGIPLMNSIIKTKHRYSTGKGAEGEEDENGSGLGGSSAESGMEMGASAAKEYVDDDGDDNGGDTGNQNSKGYEKSSDMSVDDWRNRTGQHNPDPTLDK